jgi:hypothetical protein
MKHPNVPMDYVIVADEFFSATLYEPGLLRWGTVLSTFRDSEGTQWIAFELAELHGVFVISTASTFFEGWSSGDEGITQISLDDPAKLHHSLKRILGE